MPHLFIVDINTGQAEVLSEVDEILVRVAVDLGIVSITRDQVSLLVLGILPLSSRDHFRVENRSISLGTGLDVSHSSLPDGRVGGLGEDVEICKDGALGFRLAGVAPHVGLCAGSERSTVLLDLVVVRSRGSVASDGVVRVNVLCSKEIKGKKEMLNAFRGDQNTQ